MIGRTDYIDLCGEPEFMQLITLKYHEAAQAKGVIVMHACAFGEHRALRNALNWAHPPDKHDLVGGISVIMICYTCSLPYRQTGNTINILFDRNSCSRMLVHCLQLVCIAVVGVQWLLAATKK